MSGSTDAAEPIALVVGVFLVEVSGMTRLFLVGIGLIRVRFVVVVVRLVVVVFLVVVIILRVINFLVVVATTRGIAPVCTGKTLEIMITAINRIVIYLLVRCQGYRQIPPVNSMEEPNRRYSGNV